MNGEILEPLTRIHIVDEVILQILSRLSIKSILCFKNVCKRWRDIINSPFFINRHLDHGNFAMTTDRCHMIHEDTRTSKPTIPFALLSGSAKQIIDMKDAPCPFPDGQHFASLVWGPVNGIFCIRIIYENMNKTIIFWNPGNREFHVLPQHPSNESDSVYGGFGYDSTTNDYKVIGITPGMPYSFYLYTLASNTWKQLDIGKLASDPSLIEVYSNGVMALKWVRYIAWWDGSYLNESCHWVAGKEAIVSYDLRDDVFHVTSIPDGLIQGRVIRKITIADGCLAVISLPELGEPDIAHMTSNVFDLCLMREYGVKNSWTRAYRITLKSSLHGKFLGIVGREFLVLQEREIGTGGNENESSNVVSYVLGDTQDEECYEYCSVQSPIKHFGKRFNVFPYKGSLVSFIPNNCPISQ